ncbi:FkbM family methyltransferase [Nocardia cyriacigeorgica]|nr:FkbM family methyltransferase [Nocardia cyriacigeorgica]
MRHGPGIVAKGWLAERYLNPYLRDHPREQVVDACFDAQFFVNSRDLIQRYIGLFSVWEPHMTAWLRQRLQPGDVFVDAGANIGYFAVLGSRLVGPTGSVVAVEASPVFHDMMVRNIDLNGCENVRTVNAAVSGTTETLTFVLASSANMGANSIVPYDGPAESTFAMSAVPLPDLLEPADIAGARVIMIDVEGAEGRIMRGLAPALGDMRADVEIAVEVAPDRMMQLGDDIEELLTIMGENGFHTYRLPTDYRPGSYPRALARPVPPRRWSGPITGETELVFSRIDADALT